MKLKFVLCVAMCGTMMQSAMAQTDDNGAQEKESPVVTLIEHSLDYHGHTLFPKEFSNAEELYNFMSWEIEPSGEFKVGRFSIELDFNPDVRLSYSINGMPSGAYMITRYGKGCIHEVKPELFNSVVTADATGFTGNKLSYEIYIPVNSLPEEFQFHIESIKAPNAYANTHMWSSGLGYDENGCRIN